MKIGKKVEEKMDENISVVQVEGAHYCCKQLVLVN